METIHGDVLVVEIEESTLDFFASAELSELKVLFGARDQRAGH